MGSLLALAGDARADDPEDLEQEVTIEAGATPIIEGADATFTLTRAGSADEALTVSVELTETGSMLEETSPISVAVDAGRTWAAFAVATQADRREEPDSEITATVTAASDASYVVGVTPSATVVVQDDDDVVVDLVTEVVDGTGAVVGAVPEDVGAAIIRVTASRRGRLAPTESLYIAISTRSGTARSPEDFDAFSVMVPYEVSDWVYLEAGDNYRAVLEVALEIVDDSLPEPEPETLRLLTQRSPGTAIRVNYPRDVELAIIDNDVRPGAPTDLEAIARGRTAIDLTWTAPSGTGGSEITGYRIEWSADGASDWTDLVEDSGTDATAQADSGLAPGTTRHYRVSAINTAGAGPVSNTASTTTERLSVITVEAESTPVTEGREARFLVSRAGSAEEGLEVVAEVSATGSLAFSGGPKTVTLRIERESRIHSYGLVTQGDDRDEADRNVRLKVMAPEDASYEVGSPSSAMVVVQDDDDLEVQVTTAVVDANGVAVTEVPEGVGAATIRLTATTNGSLAPTEAFRVAVSTRAASAVSPDDYGALSEEVPFAVADWVFVDAEDHYSAVKDVLLAIVDDSLDEEDRETVGLLTERAPDTRAYVSFPERAELAIVDNDEPTYALSVDPASIAEAGGVATVEVSTGGVTFAADKDFELTLGGTATLDTDYTIDATTLTLDAGQTEVATTIAAVDDTEDDDGETVVVTASLDGTTVGSAQTITIDDDDDGLPEVEFSGWTPEVIEGEVTTFTLVRSGPVTDALTVAVEVSETGSMISGQAPTSVVFPAGADFKTLNISTVDDDVDEPDSVITATLLAGEDAPYTLTTDVSLESIVTDNDDLEVDVTTAVVNAAGLVVTEVSEDVGIATIRVTATTGGSLAPTREFNVFVSTRTDGAVSPDDYTALSVHVAYQVSDWVFVGAKGSYRAVKDVSLAIVDDTLEEPAPETLGLVTERAPDTPAYVSFPPRIELAIVDNDSAPPNPVLPEVRIAAWRTPVDEGSDATFVLTRTGATTEALTVSIDATETGSMISGTAPGSAVFEAEQETTALAVPTVDDSLDEADSSVFATVTAGEGVAYEVGSDSSATVVVRDNDSVPGEPASLTAVAAGRTAIDLTWTTPSDSGTSPISGYRIEWSADGTSDWTELVADTRSDATTYSDDGLAAGTTRYYRVLAMNRVGMGSASNVSSATTAPEPEPEPDPEPEPPALPNVTIKAGTSPVDEGAEVTFVLNRNDEAAGALTVSVEVAETGSMISGTAPVSVAFAVGAAETTLMVFTADDLVDEAPSSVSATVTAGEDAGYTVGAASSATVTVNDNDAVPAAPEDLVATAEGQAVIGLRWVPPDDAGSSTVTGYRIEWSADGSSGWTELVGDTGSTKTAYRDNGLEPGTTRYYRVCAMNSTGPGPLSNVAGATTLPPPSEVTITAGVNSVDEGAEVTFLLRRSGVAAEPLTVLLEVAETGSVIRGAPPTSASFAAGAEETAVTVSTADDELDEPDRAIAVTLLDGDGYVLVGDASATVKVRDNDAAPLVVIAGASAPESAGELTFTVVLRGQSVLPGQVEWSTSAGTASPDADYAAAGGVLTLEPGAGDARIVVPVRDDALYEENETFTVNLVRPNNVRLAASASSATGVIENDDAAPVFRIADASSAESAGEIVFTVTLSGESAMPATVRWASSAETAQPRLDYVEASGELTFAPGATSRQLAVTVLEDLLVEEAETFRVSLSEATNAAFEAGSAATAVGTIEDDDDTAPAEEWLARFGRTAASNAVDAVEDRLTGRLGSGSQIVVAGHRVEVSRSGREYGATGSGQGNGATSSGQGNGATGSGQGNGAAGSAAAPVTGLGGIGQAAGTAVGLAGSGGLLDAQPGRYGSGRMDTGDLLARSSFQFSSNPRASGYSNGTAANGAAQGDDADVRRWSVWGSGAKTRFDGGQDTLSLNGEVVTGTVGADIERGRVLFGVAVSHSRGDGDYRRDGIGGLRAREGDLSSDLTTGLPYLRVAVSDRLSVWGALGRGAGSMTLSEGDLGSIEADIGMNLGAFGARRELRSSAATNGFSLALRADLLLVHTTSDETEALPALWTDVNRLRLMIEGARRFQFDSGAVLIPKVELGLRYDDGDAETGSGLEVGAGFRFENGARGLSAELTGRSLLAHEASELSEWGVGGSLRFEPGGADRGLSIGLRSTLGAASSGIIRLWEQQNAAPAGYRATAPGSVTEAEVGYGFAVLGTRGSLTPYLGAGLSQRHGEAYKAGARLRLGEFFVLDAEAARLEENDTAPSRYQAALLANLRW